MKINSLGSLRSMNKYFKTAIRKEKAKLAKLEKLRMENLKLANERNLLCEKVAQFHPWEPGAIYTPPREPVIDDDEVFR